MKDKILIVTTILMAVVLMFFVSCDKSSTEPDNGDNDDYEITINWEEKIQLSNKKIIALAVNSSGFVFAGAKREGICRSVDNGETWNTVLELLVGNVEGIVINSNDDVFAGCRYAGIYRSTNNGSYWKEIGKNWPGYSSEKLPNVSSIVINPVNNDIFAATYKGEVAKSCDNGETWTISIVQDIPANIIQERAVSLACLLNGNIFALCGEGDMYISADNGESWIRKTGLGGFSYNWTSSFYSVAPIIVNSNGDIFVGAIYGGGVYMVYSDFSGHGMKYLLETGWTGESAYDIYSLCPGPNESIFAGTAGAGIFVSTNNGETWTEINEGLGENPIIYSLAVTPNNYIFAGVFDQGPPVGSKIFRSTEPIE